MASRHELRTRGRPEPGQIGPGNFNEISVGRWETWIRNLFNIKRGGLLQTITPGVSPVLPLGQPPYFEQRLMQDIRTYASFINSAAGGAGNANIYSLHNPTDSGMLVVVEGFLYSTAGAVALFRAMLDVTGAAAGSLNPCASDTRIYRGNGGLILSLRSSAMLTVAAAVPPALTNMVFGARASNAITFPAINAQDCKIVLSPGFKLQLDHATLNSADSLYIQWYERPLEKSEQQ